MKNQQFRVCGEYDYDFEYDILFFKIKNKDYSRSIELNNVVLDFDKENLLIGVQIFDASEFLSVEKEKLKEISSWKFSAKVVDNYIEVRIDFEIHDRDKIIEKNPIIMQQLNENFPDSYIVCG